MLTEQEIKRGTLAAKISINAQLLSGEAGYRRAGIHQYISQVLRHLPQQNNLDYLVYTRHDGNFLHKANITAVATTIPTEKRSLRILWEQLIWPWQSWRQQVALLHSMAFVTPLFAAQPAIITVYDLSFMHYPEQFPTLQRQYLTSQTRRSCQQAKRIITISESSKRDIHQFFNTPLDQIDVVYPGVDSIYQPLPRQEIESFRQEKGIDRFILHVGTLQPRKNIATLLEAFAQLEAPDLDLVLVGGKGWLFADIFAKVQALNLENRVHFTGYVPDEELPLWYNAADLLLFPSFYEGFGMPIIEAMACGTPVVAANNSSIPEAVGNAGQLFAPRNVQECVDRITAVLHNPQLSAKMRALGLEHARQFSWDRAGLETAAVYQRALREE